MIKVRDELLGIFEPNIAKLLIEYNRNISKIDTDYIIFMARKAVRMHDFMLACGGMHSKKEMLSDQILDQDLSRFSGKTVTLVDDTLILGSTLYKTKKLLLEAGAKSVETVVFAVDSDNWSSDLINPDSYSLKMNSQEMINFCAQEVSALAAANIPYLTDFPVSKHIRISENDFNQLDNLSDWNMYDITDHSFRKFCVKYITFLPHFEIIDDFKNLFGSISSDIIDIAKIRLFLKKRRNSYFGRFVPIVTPSAISVDRVDDLYSYCVTKLAKHGIRERENIDFHLNSKISRLRFSQYCLSAHIGNIFTTDFNRILDRKTKIEYDDQEACRHYGTWLRRELRASHKIKFDSSNDEHSSIKNSVHELKSSKLPSEVFVQSESDLAKFKGYKKKRQNLGRRNSSERLRDLGAQFVGLYEEHELAARKAVRKYGKLALNPENELSHHRDRLSVGYPWRQLAETIVPKGRALTHRRVNQASLYLDNLVDLGIAVPIVAERNHVIFRGYRHGEDVLLTEEAWALSYDACAGFVGEMGQAKISKLVLEKILVSLFRGAPYVGILRPVYGPEEPGEVVRVGFHLHGAVTFLAEMDTYLADNNDHWFSRNLIDRGILKSVGRQFTLGARPAAATPSNSASKKAEKLGALIGILYTRTDENKKQVLNENDFITLASCPNPLATTAAIAAEVRIAIKYFNNKIVPSFGYIDWNSESERIGLYKNIRKSNANIALNSALLKIQSYRNGRPAKTMQRSLDYLRSQPMGGFAADDWEEWWSATLADDTPEQRSRFDPHINRLSSDILDMAISLVTLQFALLAGISNLPKKNVPRRVPEIEIVDSLRDSLPGISDSQSKLIDRLHIFKDNLTSEIDNQKVSRFAINNILKNKHREIIRNLENSLDSVLSFGRAAQRVSYQYVLWYDIIDSRSEKAKLTQSDRDDYLSRVQKLKSRLRSEFRDIAQNARKRGGYVDSSEGSMDSKDDEKLLFFSGNRTMQRLKVSVLRLLNTAKAQGLCVRICILPAGFAGIEAHRYIPYRTVQGESFWTHFRELEKELKALESDDGGNERGKVPCYSYIWYWDQKTRDNVKLETKVKIDGEISTTINTEVSGDDIYHPISGGKICPTGSNF